jgi:thiamine-monophosphate kinase
MVRRNGAKAGDRIMVSGTSGDAALGLQVRRDPAVAAQWGLDKDAGNHLLSRYRLPQPRSVLAAALRRHAAAAMDISDGLAGDLRKLCLASGLSAEIEIARVPLSAAARQALAADPRLRETILTGGDDYELLAAVRPDKLDAFSLECAREGVAVTDIGEAVTGEAMPKFLDQDGRAVALSRLSFSHF